ncbi:hypothetical protein ACET3X_004615 [Alternaria dauci]|uniref:Uncharacterized protein n=1 Tax=Alternaria dauci TaxID=48095 RepID=A0ABR3UNV1_9PLEO
MQAGDNANVEVSWQNIAMSTEIPHVKEGIRWIHVPVNNLGWVNHCFAKCGYEMHSDITTMKMRPIASRQAKADQPTRLLWPEHAKHLDPSCTLGSYARNTSRGESSLAGASSSKKASSQSELRVPPLTVYLPYMSWMLYRQYETLAKALEKARSNREAVTRGPEAGSSKARIQPVPLASAPEFQASGRVDGMSSWPSPKTFHNVHNPTFPTYPSRTLDQFYYPALNDTSFRDKDQTISKWSGTPLEQDGRDKAASDSLMIMVDQFWCWIVDEKTIITSFPSGLYCQGPTYVVDPYWGITKSLTLDPQPLRNVGDMYSLLIKEVTGYMFSEVNRNSVDMVEIYRLVNGKKAASQTTNFQEFQQGYASGRSDDSILNDRRDMKLVLEVADIIEELKSLDLLNLKSNAASLAEAQAATTQGRAVMLFTIITVIFLPLSFFTSYFGQNVKEFTGDEKNPSSWHLWRIAMPITVVVVVAALLVALYITQPNSPLWLWKASAGTKAPATAEIGPTRTRQVKWWNRNPFTLLRHLGVRKRRTNNQDVQLNNTQPAV